MKQLFQNYLSQNQSHIVSYGTFIALTRFCIPSATTNVIEMCTCKKDLHVRWGIQALINCCAKQGIDLKVTRNYESFLNIQEETVAVMKPLTWTGVVHMISIPSVRKFQTNGIY